MYNVIFELLNLLVFKLYLSHALFSCTVKLVLCAPPSPPTPDDESGPSLPTNEGPGIIGQAVFRLQPLPPLPPLLPTSHFDDKFSKCLKTYFK